MSSRLKQSGAEQGLSRFQGSRNQPDRPDDEDWEPDPVSPEQTTQPASQAAEAEPIAQATAASAGSTTSNSTTVTSAASTPPAAPAQENGRSGFAGKRREREVFWNLPNAITVGRIAMVPVMLLIPFMLSEWGSQVMAWCFILAALSDILDGWLARRGGGEQITRIGKLLDPLADKLLVSTALVMLLAVGRIPVWAAPLVVIIIGRELAVTGLRSMASTDGDAVGASWQGKLKAFVQNFAVGALLFHYQTIGLPAHELGLVTLTLAAALTMWSGWVYFADYFRSEA